MIYTIVRCPGSFFDTTPSGMLVNKFSNDLGILDNIMIFGLIDALEGPSIIIIAIINIVIINWIFVFAAAIIMGIAVWFFTYSRQVIQKCKQLDLQNKTPIFHFFGETISGLTQIKVFNYRKQKIQ